LVAVFWINTLAIECWENAANRQSRMRLRPRVSRELALHLGAAGFTLAAIAGLIAWTHAGASNDATLYAAIALSALILAALELDAPRWSRPALRVLADAALLTPIPFLLADRL
jgi:peptidoglycan/LPS O-acetylase OafA/YrhL